MSKKEEQWLEDCSRFFGASMNQAIHTAADAKNRFEDMIKERIELTAKDMGFVTREEFDVVKSMVEKLEKELKKHEKAPHPNTKTKKS